MVSRGFTIIEVLIVLALLTALSALSLPLFDWAIQRAHEKELRETLRDVRRGIDAYRGTRADAVSMLPPCIASLTGLIPSDLLKTNGNPGPFLSAIPVHHLILNTGTFFWDIREGSGTWVLKGFL